MKTENILKKKSHQKADCGITNLNIDKDLTEVFTSYTTADDNPRANNHVVLITVTALN